MEKFKLIMDKVIVRMKSPVVWAGIIAIVGLIFSTAGYTLSDVSTWQGLGAVITAILFSPEKLAMIIVALYAFLNNPSTKEKF